jgi:PRTRC genetic system protein A
MERNLELEGMLVGHFIGEIPHKYNKPVLYVMRGDGLWEIRTNSLGVFRRMAAKVCIPGLPYGFKEGFELSVPKIPVALLWQAIAFFRQVYELHESESAVRVVYDQKCNRYFLDCPPQEVCAVHCHFDRKQTFKDAIVVAEIHSHGQMSASFSKTDDKDELADRFYGIVGKVTDFFPETRFRLSIGGNHLDVTVDELFNTENDPLTKAKFPPSWLDQVKEQELPKLPSSWSNRRLKRLLDDPENLLMFDDEDDEEEQIEDSVLTDFEEEECKWFKSQRNWRK